MRLTHLLLVGLAVSAPLLAPPPARADDKVLRVALEFDPAALDPATDGSYTNRVVTTVMCDSLIDLSADLKFVHFYAL